MIHVNSIILIVYRALQKFRASVVNDVFRDARRQLAGALYNNNFIRSFGGLREFEKCNKDLFKDTGEVEKIYIKELVL